MQRKRASVLPLFVFQLGNLYSLQKTRREVFHALKSCQAAAWRHDTERGLARFSDCETKRGLGEKENEISNEMDYALRGNRDGVAGDMACSWFGAIV